ncbi:MAG TPA: aldose 1-epimerase family protein [Steroidobacteraceae bacterium]|nr:aldose 1-epimerase family protein [Steroidobacteraceae bacterium]
MSDDDGWLTLSSGALSAQISPLGAQLSSLRDASGHDLLWDGNPAFWIGRAPLLFPIVGALAGGAYRVAGRSYALPRHGFARDRRFEVLSASRTAALLRLQADARTLAAYPFRFQLRLRFEIAGATLLVTAWVGNDGDAPMPASFGFHPAFRWPLPLGAPRAQHAIVFEVEEPAPIRRLNAAGLMTPVHHPTPIRARRLLLDDALFAEDAVILDAVRSRQVSYGADTGPRLTVRFPDTPYLGIWSKPGAPFVCIEPWHGMADPVGFTGDILEKPGIFIVPPAAQREIGMQVILTEETREAP